MKVIFRLLKMFIISISTLFIINSFPSLDSLYKALGVTEYSTKEKIVAIISTFFLGIIFEFFPYLFRKYVADKIKISVTYLQKKIPITKLNFKKSVDIQHKEIYEPEIVKINFSLNEGTAIGYKLLNKLNAKVILQYNPDQFSTVKNDGSIIQNNSNDDELISRDSKGYIYMNIFNGFSSVGDFSMDQELFIKPKHTHINKSSLVIKVQTNNWVTSLLANTCVEIINNKLILERKEE